MDAPQISKPVLWFFRRVVRRYFRRHFRAVRLSHAAPFTGALQGPVIVYANHSSWWDPMVSVLLAAQLQPSRQHFAPMDAEALERYGILRRVGIFPVETETSRGAAQFLRTGLALLERGGVLWVTPQGKFCDPRESPMIFKPGLAGLAGRVPGGCTVIPLAIEYTFWDERLPEVLLHFGDPVHVHGQPRQEVEAALKLALEESMQALASKAIARDSTAFDILQSGRVGAGGWYQFGQKTLARLRRRPYQPEHTKAATRAGQG